ncbi:MAG: hypothetical protein CVU62_02465 [Deltaproteobacteria bacterium HGW-Deltaproteobacteria-2]|nr:MAG: hypothetical protein CVU62_02465 [Deltaproteobacteria bacterium HGW-Deltaproteobacteria-2]
MLVELSNTNGSGLGTIPRSGWFNTPQLATESVPKACFGIHTCDSNENIPQLYFKNNFDMGMINI